MTEKSIYDIRRENLNILIDVYGSIARINQLTGRPRTDSSLSQIRNQTVNTVNYNVRRMARTLRDPWKSNCVWGKAGLMLNTRTATPLR